MPLYRGTIRTDIQGSDVEFEFDVDEDADADEIHEAAKDAAFNHIEWFYELMLEANAIEDHAHPTRNPDEQ